MLFRSKLNIQVTRLIMTLGRYGLASQRVSRDEELHNKLQSGNAKKNRTGIFEFRITFSGNRNVP